MTDSSQSSQAAIIAAIRAAASQPRPNFHQEIPPCSPVQGVDVSNRPMQNASPSFPTTNVQSLSCYSQAKPAFQPASHSAHGLVGLPMATSGFLAGDTLYNRSSPSLRTIPPSVPAFQDVRTHVGFNQCQNMWRTTLEQNKKIIEEWQGRLLAQSSFSDHNSSKSTTGYDSDSNPGSDVATAFPTASSFDRTRRSSGSFGTELSFDAKAGGACNTHDSDSTSSSTQLARRNKRTERTEERKREQKREEKRKRRKERHTEKDGGFKKRKDEEHRPRGHVVSRATLKPLFHLPLKQAAAKLGMSSSEFKKAYRNVGLERWPYSELIQILNSEV